MKAITTTVDIAAPPSAVWEALMDFESYPEWNPFVVAISGAPRVGSHLSVRLARPGRTPVTIRPTVTAFAEGRALEWLGSVWFRGIFDGRHRFELIPTETGTRLDHSERFAGILAPVVLRAIGRDTRLGFEAMNSALRDRVEG